MTVYAHILGEASERLWGLSSRERLQRMLTRAGVTTVVDDVGSLPTDSSVVLLRGDYLYDDRVISSLVKSSNVVLQVASGENRASVAAHVPAAAASQVRAMVCGTPDSDGVPGIRFETPRTLSSSFYESLLKSEPPFVEPITHEHRGVLERRLFSGAYKGVTDLVTKWVWPVPARWVTRLCVRFGIRPNHVTALSVLLTIMAGACFAYGHYGWGLLAGWLMTFLDTVDGKLARVTVTTSRFGHALDKALDLIHPPLWYLAWGVGLDTFHPGVAGVSLHLTLWLIVIGYLGGRVIEGAFLLWLGVFGIFCWRPIDSYFRLITARRNPILLLLTGSLVLGRPDLGLVAVAFWTVVSSLLLLLRLVMAFYARMIGGPLRSWMADIDRDAGDRSLAVRLFTQQTTEQSLGQSQ